MLPSTCRNTKIHTRFTVVYNAISLRFINGKVCSRTKIVRIATGSPAKGSSSFYTSPAIRYVHIVSAPVHPDYYILKKVMQFLQTRRKVVLIRGQTTKADQVHCLPSCSGICTFVSCASFFVEVCTCRNFSSLSSFRVRYRINLWHNLGDAKRIALI
jgi:hypothetical protein